MERVCESSASEDDDLAVVRRVYVTPETWDQAGSVEQGDQDELWCFPCRSLYPHQPVDPG